MNTNCYVEKLDCIISNPNVNEYLGELRVMLKGSESSGNLILRPITDGTPTATYNGVSITVDGTTYCESDGELIIKNKYDLRIINYANKAISAIMTDSFSYCKGIVTISCTNLLKGDIANLGGLTNLSKLLVGSSSDLTGNIASIAALPLTILGITGSKVYGTLEKYIAERARVQEASSGSFLFAGNMGDVTFKGSKIIYYSSNRTVAWSPNSSNPSNIDIVFDSTGAEGTPVTETIDADGNPVV